MDVVAPIPTVLAVVAGQPVTELPADLFIPPDALEVLLDSFTGPLDILLYLIRQQDLDILDIPMALITEQYMQYIELLEERRMGLAADYLVMAALLVEIKSRLLLPVSPSELEDEEEDPRMELVRRLQIYEQFKKAALELDTLPRFERDVYQVQTASDQLELKKAQPDVDLASIVAAMAALLQRQQHLLHHEISREVLSVRERMGFILERLQLQPTIEFRQLLDVDEGRMGLVVMLLAILELAKEALIIITQLAIYGPIHLNSSE